MSTWSGWEIEFFAAAHILNTPPNQRFLTTWAAHATSPGCRNNPIDLSVALPGSVNCANNSGVNRHTERYLSHKQAADAFNQEIHEPFAKAILEALNSGNPFEDPNWNDVVSALVSWGSVNFANWYSNAAQAAGGGGGGGGGGTPGRAHGGWHDLRRSINHNMPKALRSSGSNTRAALRSLSQARKVRL